MMPIEVQAIWSHDALLMTYNDDPLLVYKRADGFLRFTLPQPITTVSLWNAAIPIIFFGQSSVWPAEAVLDYGKEV